MTQAELQVMATQVAAELTPVLKRLREDMIARTEAVRAEIAPLRQSEQRNAAKLAAIERVLAAAQPRKAA